MLLSATRAAVTSHHLQVRASGVVVGCPGESANRPLCGGMNQPHAGGHPRSRHQTGRSTAIRIGGHSPDFRGSAVSGPCGSSRQPPTAGWVRSCPAGVCPRQPRGCPDLEISHPAQAGRRGRSCGRPGGLAQCAGFRSGRCGRVKLPVFLPGRRSLDRDNFCPMQRNSMPHRPGAGARAGVIDGSGQCCWPRRSRSFTCPGYRFRPAPGTCAVVVQMDAAMADAALDVAGRSARRRRGVRNEEAQCVDPGHP